MNMNDYTVLEIAIECAWQIGDKLENQPRCASRWRVADIALDIVSKGIITDMTEDIDEVISAYLTERGLK